MPSLCPRGNSCIPRHPRSAGSRAGGSVVAEPAKHLPFDARRGTVGCEATHRRGQGRSMSKVVCAVLVAAAVFVGALGEPAFARSALHWSGGHSTGGGRWGLGWARWGLERSRRELGRGSMGLGRQRLVGPRLVGTGLVRFSLRLRLSVPLRVFAAPGRAAGSHGVRRTGPSRAAKPVASAAGGAPVLLVLLRGFPNVLSLRPRVSEGMDDGRPALDRAALDTALINHATSAVGGPGPA